MSNEHSPQHKEVLKKQALEQSEVKEVLNVIKKYFVPVTLIIIVVCGIFLFDRYLKASKVAKETKANIALANARGVADLEEVINEYGSTSAAPQAMMSLAMAYFSEGNYDAAQEEYEKFLKKYGKHDMALQAELNQITCREAKGEYSEANLLYNDFASTHKNSYLVPVAIMGEARCLEAMKSPIEAKCAYEDLVVSYPGSSWADLAETRLTLINSKLQ